MKNFIQQVVRKNIFFLLGAGWLLTIAFIIDNYWYSSSSIRYLRTHIERDIQRQEKSFDKFLTDTALLRRLSTQTYSEKEMQQYTNTDRTPYCIFLYNYDEYGNLDLRYWNTQLVLLGNDVLLSKESNKMVNQPSGQYEFIRRQVTIANDQKLTAVALIPVHREYYIEIKNLRKEFIGYPQADKNLSMTDRPTDFPVKSTVGKTLFYLQMQGLSEKDETNWLTVTLNIIAIILLLIVVHHTAHYFSITYGYLKGITFLVGTIVLLRGLTYFFPALLNVRQYDIFDPTIYSSSRVLNSLGDLLINAFLFCWIVLFIRVEVGEKRFSLTSSKSWYWVTITIPLFILVATTFVFAGIIQTLISDAQISFNVTNFFSLLNIYSLGGFIVLATLSLSYFFLSQVILQLISPLIVRQRYIMFAIIAVIGLLLLTVVKSNSFVQLNIYVLLWLLGYTWFMDRQIFSGSGFKLAISEVLVWLFIFSFSVSSVIIIENQRRGLDERKRMAEKLSARVNPSSVKLLSIALTYIDNDFLFRNFDRFQLQYSNQKLKDSLLSRNFEPYLDAYDMKIYTFDSAATPRPLFNEDPVSYDTLNTIFNIEGRNTNTLNIKGLRYVSKSYDKFSYIYRKEVKDTLGKTIGYFFVLSEPKRYKKDALVPELFSPPQKDLLPESSLLSTAYAVYSNGRLVDYSNDYQFPTQLTAAMIPKRETEQRSQNGYDELWYKDNQSVVVIARKDNYWLEGITLVAYLFSTFLVLLAIFRVIAMMVQTRLRWHLLKQFFQVNLRAQIHGTFIFITLVSFIVILITTIFFFINRYKRNNIDRLSKTMQIMNNQVELEIGRHEAFDDMVKLYESGANKNLESLARRVADIHGTDVNFYDLQGDLKVSSSLYVYNKGILSMKMNPVAYYNLNSKKLVQFINEEQMGRVSYQSIYSPVRDTVGNVYAYLNIPSFDSQSELQREISNFLVTIINLNAFIFLIAGALALFITNR
ncbi:MAG: hypothetical protein JST39_16615, partial [Bacteroidetes bacterium]|nr:hypothetical protein [Bacteroidota bacterium]